MVKKLAELGLVEYARDQDIAPTPDGEKVALEVLRHHRLLELYLHDKLHLPWDQVHDEAERLEHVISETLEDAIATALDDRRIDPHGDPIPTKDGKIAADRRHPAERRRTRSAISRAVLSCCRRRPPGLPGWYGPLPQCHGDGA